jgi:hypothetical protein
MICVKGDPVSPSKISSFAMTRAYGLSFIHIANKSKLKLYYVCTIYMLQT